MARVKHPYTGKSTLEWEQMDGGVLGAYVTREARYLRGSVYNTREFFATIRPAYNDAGMLDAGGGWVVTRSSFEELRSFDDLDKAKIYVQSLFALEMT